MSCCDAQNTDLKQAIAAALQEKKMIMLGTLAQRFNISEKQVAENLPDGMCVLACGSKFEEIWKALGEWEKATFIVQHMGHVLEIKCRIEPGVTGGGYYNIMKSTTLGGHIKADQIAAIGFLSMPFMGLESHSVPFFNTDGAVVFSIYAGRENHKIIPAIKDSFLKLKAQYAQSCAAD